MYNYLLLYSLNSFVHLLNFCITISIKVINLSLKTCSIMLMVYLD